jgi:hypothetical protein
MMDAQLGNSQIIMILTFKKNIDILRIDATYF